MKRLGVLSVAAFFLFAASVARAQDHATLKMDENGGVHAGGPISFLVKLNEQLPKGAHFDLRIAPIHADEQIALGSGTPVDGSDTVFRVMGTLPKGAIPGEWHIAVIYLFLPGAGWTSTTIAPNDLRFKVEGKPYPIPTKADVTLDR